MKAPIFLYEEVEYMADKILNTRLVNKHDTEENWLKAVNFIPKQGEIIVYDIDANYNYERLKMGDGVTVVSSLPFINDIITNEQIDAICGSNIVSIEEVRF